MDFFSDRECETETRVKEDINIPVWNGLCAIIEKHISNISLAKDFPEQCPDSMGICGTDPTLFYDTAKAMIPSLEIPISRKDERTVSVFDPIETKNIVDTYVTLDLIEFCYIHIYDPIKKGSIHDYFQHYHYAFATAQEQREVFRESINDLFRRNSIAFELNERGQIIRVTPQLFLNKFKEIHVGDQTTNELINVAIASFIQPKKVDRRRALEKLWDAFERLKTILDADKITSINKLIEITAKGNQKIKEDLKSECRALTEIGNVYQIRHFETRTHELNESTQIDYLFYRMYAIIDLFTRALNGIGLKKEKIGEYVIYKEGKGYKCKDGFSVNYELAITFKTDATALKYRAQNNLIDIEVLDRGLL